MSDLAAQIAETREAFAKLKEDIHKEIEGGIIAAAMMVKSEAKKMFRGHTSNREADSLNPDPFIDTGLLRQSIDYELNTDKDGARIGSSLDYAASYEYGETSRVPHPFMNPALVKSEPEILHRFEKGFLQVLDKRR